MTEPKLSSSFVKIPFELRDLYYKSGPNKRKNKTKGENLERISQRFKGSVHVETLGKLYKYIKVNKLLKVSKQS